MRAVPVFRLCAHCIPRASPELKCGLCPSSGCAPTRAVEALPFCPATKRKQKMPFGGQNRFARANCTKRTISLKTPPNSPALKQWRRFLPSGDRSACTGHTPHAKRQRCPPFLHASAWKMGKPVCYLALRRPVGLRRTHSPCKAAAVPAVPPHFRVENGKTRLLLGSAATDPPAPRFPRKKRTCFPAVLPYTVCFFCAIMGQR